jgi:hypothetical protein
LTWGVSAGSRIAGGRDAEGGEGAEEEKRRRRKKTEDRRPETREEKLAHAETLRKVNQHVMVLHHPALEVQAAGDEVFCPSTLVEPLIHR